jgi:hypothetical protein
MRSHQDRRGQIHHTDDKGVYQPVHGLRKSSEYNSWAMMKKRCLNPNCKDYPNYGGRGITLDPRWHSFAEFYSEMGPKPAAGYTLERKDSNKGYSAQNCVWATRTEQVRNRRMTKLTLDVARQIRERYTKGGVSQRQLAAEYHVSQSLIKCVVLNRYWADPA